MSEEINEIYMKGFNQAYLLAKYQMQLIEQFSKIDSSSEYVQGLKDGKHTFEKSQTISRTKELENLKSKRSKDRDRELDI